ASSIASACNWTNVNVGYGDSCNRYNFEVSGTTDTCFKIEAKIYLGTTLKATYLKRNFKHYFQDTGMYVVRVKIINTCTNCDTIIYKQIHVTCKPSGSTTGCDWSKSGIYYSQNCNKFTFEMGSFDTCFKYITMVIGNGHVDTISDNRVFTYTFSDTGTYYIRTTFRNKCTNCDTIIYKQIRVSCLLSTGCNWSKVGINYSQNCNKFTFEMGSFDTCFKYITMVIGNGHVDTISDNRVFTHTFSDTGTYYIRTTFRNKCTNCDTVMYKEIRITCLTAGIQSWNDMAHPVSVYPNPAASSVTIGVENIHQLGEVNLVLYSPLGNVIYEQKVHADTNEIPISHLSNGIYLLQLTSDKHVYAASIQIQH
ncbi:MAG: T9SS type A sorting domain-containing protein, partial [Bacteroidia bacterium]